MKAKELMIGMGLGVIVLVAGTHSWAGDRIRHTQVKQRHGITDGIRNGKIANREFVRLNREQRGIQQGKRKALADGRFTTRERRHLNNLQNRAHKHIYGAKHNKLGHYYHGKLAYRHRHHYRHGPTYRGGYHLSGTYFGPYHSFMWSIGSR